MNAMNEMQACRAAEAKVVALGLAAGEALGIAHGATREIEQGWVFFYNTEEFLKTGNPLAALAGNAPLLVLRTGQILLLPTSVPWQDALQSLRYPADGYVN